MFLKENDGIIYDDYNSEDEGADDGENDDQHDDYYNWAGQFKLPVIVIEILLLHITII